MVNRQEHLCAERAEIEAPKQTKTAHGSAYRAKQDKYAFAQPTDQSTDHHLKQKVLARFYAGCPHEDPAKDRDTLQNLVPLDAFVNKVARAKYRRRCVARWEPLQTS